MVQKRGPVTRKACVGCSATKAMGLTLREQFYCLIWAQLNTDIVLLVNVIQQFVSLKHIFHQLHINTVHH